MFNFDSFPPWKQYGFSSEKEALEYVNTYVNTPPEVKPPLKPSRQQTKTYYFADGTKRRQTETIRYGRELTIFGVDNPDHLEDIFWGYPVESVTPAPPKNTVSQAEYAKALREKKSKSLADQAAARGNR